MRELLYVLLTSGSGTWRVTLGREVHQSAIVLATRCWLLRLSRTLEPAKTAIVASLLWCRRLESTEAVVRSTRIVHGRLLLQAGEHVVLGCGRLAESTGHGGLWLAESIWSAEAILLLLLGWLLVARVKCRGPLIGLILLGLGRSSHHIELSSHTIVLLLLLERAIEELWLKASIATILSRLISLHIHRILRLLLLLLLKHLHLLEAGLLLLLGVVPVGHDLEGGVFSVRRVRLRVAIHHLHQLIDHFLLLIVLLLRLLLNRLLSLLASTCEVTEAVVLLLLLLWGGRDEITELVIVVGGSCHADQVGSRLSRHRLGSRCSSSLACRHLRWSFLDFSWILRWLFAGSLLFFLLLLGVPTRASSVHAPLDKLVKAIALVLKKIERIVLHVRVNIALLDVLLVEKARNFARTSILCWFLEVLRKVSFPVGVDEVVVHGLEGLDFAIGPLVQVHRLYLRDMNAQGTMLT